MERVLQFGTGRFLRGFVEAFLDDQRRTASPYQPPVTRRVTAVESTGSGMAARLAEAGLAYRLAVRGLDGSRVIDEERCIEVIDRVVDASADTATLRDAAHDTDISMIVSNTTEAGYAPGAYPARLAMTLAARAREGLPGVLILPCELVERNGQRLRELVRAELEGAGSDAAVVRQVDEANTWATTLVDRIVTSPAAEPAGGPAPLDVVVEPFASWVIEAPVGAAIIDHPSVERTDDVTPYALRKIRILNGAHTALVARTKATGLRTVREAMADVPTASWLEELLQEEIVPTLDGRVADAATFAATVLERFSNPFLDHRLADIAANHGQKVRLRLLPTYEEHIRLFGAVPPRLDALLRGEGVS